MGGDAICDVAGDCSRASSCFLFILQTPPSTFFAEGDDKTHMSTWRADCSDSQDPELRFLSRGHSEKRSNSTHKISIRSGLEYFANCL